MKLTKNQAMLILAGTILLFILMVCAYGSGLLMHEYVHF